MQIFMMINSRKILYTRHHKFQTIRHYFKLRRHQMLPGIYFASPGIEFEKIASRKNLHQIKIEPVITHHNFCLIINLLTN